MERTILWIVNLRLDLDHMSNHGHTDINFSCVGEGSVKMGSLSSLDAFLKRAARLRGTDLRAPAVLNEAAELLPRHADRATEIAMAVSRMGSFETRSVQRFTAAYQQVLNERLPENGSSKAQSREAGVETYCSFFSVSTFPLVGFHVTNIEPSF